MSVASPTTFRQDLEQAVQGKHSKMHPFTEKWVKGELTRRQFGQWAAQHYHYVGPFPEWLAALYARVHKFDVQSFFLENMWEEEMGTRHVDLLVRFAEACGLTRDEVLNVDLLPTTLGLRGWCYELAHDAPFAEVAAALLIGLESQTTQIYQRNTPPLKEKYGFSDHELEFFYVHMEVDVTHSARGYEIVERYATTPEDQELAVKAVRKATEMRWMYMTGIHQAFVASQA